MGYGIVGGRLVSWEQQGREAAAMALRIMRGEPAASIPFGGEQAYVDVYDWRELDVGGTSPNRLFPPEAGSGLGAFHVGGHRQAIKGAIALMAIETFLILGLVINLRRRRLAEQSLSESEAR